MDVNYRPVRMLKARVSSHSWYWLWSTNFTGSPGPPKAGTSPPREIHHRKAPPPPGNDEFRATRQPPGRGPSNEAAKWLKNQQLTNNEQLTSKIAVGFCQSKLFKTNQTKTCQQPTSNQPVKCFKNQQLPLPEASASKNLLLCSLWFCSSTHQPLFQVAGGHHRLFPLTSAKE